MAEGKKGFIMYADQKEIFDQLSDLKAGKLIKHIFKYVNDENPKTDDMIINLAFTPIKTQLKRDLKHWENIREQRSKAGKLGGRPKKQKETKKPNALFDKQTKAKKAVIDNVNVIVNDNDTVNVNDNDNLYKSITKIWFDFVEKRNGIKPSFDGVQGKSLKSIINYIEKQKKQDQKTDETFKYILEHWGMLDEWMQSSCLDLKIFNSKINSVIDQIKNGKKGFTKTLDQHFRETDPNYSKY